MSDVWRGDFVGPRSQSLAGRSVRATLRPSVAPQRVVPLPVKRLSAPVAYVLGTGIAYETGMRERNCAPASAANQGRMAWEFGPVVPVWGCVCFLAWDRDRDILETGTLEGYARSYLGTAKMEPVDYFMG